MSAAELTAELVAAVEAQHRVLLALRPLIVEATAELRRVLADAGVELPILDLLEQLDDAAVLGNDALLKASEAGLR